MKIVINAIGLISHSSLRAGDDGVTYFGRKKNIKKVNNSDHNHESTTIVRNFKKVLNYCLETSCK